MILFFKAAPVSDRYSNQPLITGYRGIKSPGESSYGATEGCGLYLTPDIALARYFSATHRAAKYRYRKPLNPLSLKTATRYGYLTTYPKSKARSRHGTAHGRRSTNMRMRFHG